MVWIIFFVTDETFDSMIQKDDFLEYAKYVSHSYGTPRSYVEENLNLGKNVILEIEIQGALKVKEKNKRCCPDVCYGTGCRDTA